MTAKPSDIFQFNQAFTPTLFQHIKGILEAGDFGWCFVENTAYSSVVDESNLPSFSQLIFKEGQRFFPVSYMIEAGLMGMLDAHNMRIKDLLRIRVGLIPKSHKSVNNTAHIDALEPHLTALIYLTTCNAPTIIYKNFYDHEKHPDPYDYMIEQFKGKMKVEAKIPSVENTGVIFNGHRYHSSSVPTDVYRRIVININFTIF